MVLPSLWMSFTKRIFAKSPETIEVRNVFKRLRDLSLQAKAPLLGKKNSKTLTKTPLYLICANLPENSADAKTGRAVAANSTKE